MNTIEVLSPAGSPESLLPALRCGADAVYLGGSHFNARGNAGNFDNEALEKAVRDCHTRGVKVYLAVNTLVRDDELAEAMRFIEYACSLPVDALIVQDVGLVSLVHAAAPEMRLHGSTQMSVHTPAGAAALYDAGFSRVVLSRELTREEIKEIHASSPIELEVFVHGALCMSVSGQCYFSAMLGGRSGNRGQCAQPCRLPFCAPGGTGHDLSLKDNSILTLLPDLYQIGVTSAKIEGRMKRPEYVAAAVSACRLAADGQPLPRERLEQLEAVFSRSGFTDGYYTGRRGRAMFGIRQKEDVTAATGAVFTSLHALYNEEPQKLAVDFVLHVPKDAPVTLQAQDTDGHTAYAQEAPAQAALKVSVSEQRCREQLEKTGGTPFYCRSAQVCVAPGLSLPASALNRLRRQVLAELEEKRAAKEPIAFSTVSVQSVEKHVPASPIKLRACFPHAQVPQVFSACELVYVPLSTPQKELESLLQRGIHVAVDVPRGMFGAEPQIKEQLLRAQNAGIRDVRVNNLGALALAQQTGMKIHGGFGLNLFNTASLEWAGDMGLADTELSFELTLEQVSKMGGTLGRGLLAYGRLPLMLTRNCPAANRAQGCKDCKKYPSLTDRKGMEFPLLCRGGCTEVLNAVPLYMADRMHEMKAVDFAVLLMTVENSVESEENFRVFNSQNKPNSGFTRGLYYRGVD